MPMFFRVASCAPTVSPANIDQNVKKIIELTREVYSKYQPELIVFPELSVTGYTIADLLESDVVVNGIAPALDTLCQQLKDLDCVVIVGAPVADGVSLFNSALALCHGKVIARADKAYIPNYNEFYERRWFAPSHSWSPFLDINGVKVAMEICEDLWVPCPPSTRYTLEGAQVIVNLSASDDNVGKYQYLRHLIEQQSARCICGYVYSSCGYGESTTDLVFDPKTFIYENGKCMAANERWQMTDQYRVADINIACLNHDRREKNTFGANAKYLPKRDIEVIKVDLPQKEYQQILSPISPLPFVPSGAQLETNCSEIFNIQTLGLCRRMQAIWAKNLVIGISGGLDSTLALLVAVEAFDRLGIPRTGIHGITMPGFGTSNRTKSNAFTLMERLGVSIREIPIAEAVSLHFRDIGHDPKVMDITYENSQARERTQLLMDIANQVNGMVLGTGDLSELALGWATYNGDHMSMYGVNASVPKTVVRHLVRWIAGKYKAKGDQALSDCLIDIVDTPVSPELLPNQVTEDAVGPYELHDFFLYYTLRFGLSPKQIFRLAHQAFSGEDHHYSDEQIWKWMRVFFKRFFAQQFKRSCLPDGPKTGSVCLSPRGDWRMPSDASSAMWLSQIPQV